jgi:ElaB/YqjD/DUF883 family membrane-anchored ribosome-binding protein
MEETLMPAAHADDRADDAMTELARLRAQVESLMRDKVATVVDGAERIEAAARDAADLMHDRAEDLSRTVRERPLTAVLVAVGVGYLIGRLAR